MSVCSDAYEEIETKPPVRAKTVGVSGLVDTGAQICIMGTEIMSRMGLRADDLLDCKMRVSAANNAALEILGAVFLTLSGEGGVSARNMV